MVCSKIDPAKEGTEYAFKFANAGNYTVKAALVDPSAKYVDKTFSTLAAAFSNAEMVLAPLSDHKTIEITSSTSSSKYGVKVTGDNVTVSENNKADRHEKKLDTFYKDGAVYKVTGLKA